MFFNFWWLFDKLPGTSVRNYKRIVHLLSLTECLGSNWSLFGRDRLHWFWTRLFGIMLCDTQKWKCVIHDVFRDTPINTSLNITALYSTALLCTSLQYTAPHCTALHRTALHCTSLHCTALQCTALHCTALQQSTAQAPPPSTASPPRGYSTLQQWRRPAPVSPASPPPPRPPPTRDTSSPGGWASC